MQRPERNKVQFFQSFYFIDDVGIISHFQCVLTCNPYRHKIVHVSLIVPPATILTDMQSRHIIAIRQQKRKYYDNMK